MAKVIEIPASAQVREILRVAPYCRVSSASDDQLHSYEAQIDYYTKMAAARPGWELVDVYADEAVSGTRMEKREDLERLMADCGKGRIDKVLVKSISRLARNTADSLTILRDLKQMGVSVEIEKENIDTAQLGNEMLLMFWSSHAQAESVSISRNMRWSYEKRMKKGEFITCHAPFGYRLKDGKELAVEENEAKTVRRIFESYLTGMGVHPIVQMLNDEGVPSPVTSRAWNHTAVQYILKNEKCVGDTLTQKTYTTDTFPFERRKNNGEREKFYIRNTHPAIVTRDVFDRVQALLAQKRPEPVERKSHPLTKMAVCGRCGGLFRRRVTENGYACWVCWRHNGRRTDCDMPRIAEADIHDAFIRLANKLREYRGAVLEPALTQLEDLQKATRAQNGRLIEVKAKLAVLAGQAHTLNGLRADGLLDDETWQIKGNAIAQKRAELRKEQRRLTRDGGLTEQIVGLRELAAVIRGMEKPLTVFDAGLFAGMVEKVTILSAEKICFQMVGGVEIAERMGLTG